MYDNPVVQKKSFIIVSLTIGTTLVNTYNTDLCTREQTACQKIKDIIALPYQNNPQPLEWTPFVDNLLILLKGTTKYKSLYNDLKLLRAPRGIRAVKLIWIAKKLACHKEILQTMCGRNEPLSIKEGRRIATYLIF